MGNLIFDVSSGLVDNSLFSFRKECANTDGQSPSICIVVIPSRAEGISNFPFEKSEILLCGQHQFCIGSSLADSNKKMKEGDEQMAFFYMRTSIIKASKGKSAVASAAYMSGQSLYNERLGKTFSYRNKEEVEYCEVLLPENAPREYQDRKVLWNAVEAKENKTNSRYARQFIIATPKEWTKEETIERVRTFLKAALVNQGMCVDWAFHNKEGNPHVHIMTTVRGFNKDGSWAQMEKKVYALDKDGNKIPEVDENTGLQKERRRMRNGKESIEKIWKRETVQVNGWNSKSFLNDVKKQWADLCNQYLDEKQQMDHRSYRERGINKVPTLHEGAEARALLQKGIVSDVIKENRERKELNRLLKHFESLLKKARRQLEKVRSYLERWGYYEQGRSKGTDRVIEGDGRFAQRLSGIIARSRR